MWHGLGRARHSVLRHPHGRTRLHRNYGHPLPPSLLLLEGILIQAKEGDYVYQVPGARVYNLGPRESCRHHLQLSALRDIVDLKPASAHHRDLALPFVAGLFLDARTQHEGFLRLDLLHLHLDQLLRGDWTLPLQ